MRIFLIGYMGCGKTSVGQKLARKLNLTFIDTDQLIESQQGQSVQDIFKEKGEASFRQLEEQVLSQFSDSENVLVSTGGGFPCYNNNMSKLNELGLTIYLKTSSIELAKRLKEAKEQRPLIKEIPSDRLEPFIRQQLEVRNEHYLQAKMIAVGKEQRVNLLYERIRLAYSNQLP